MRFFACLMMIFFTNLVTPLANAATGNSNDVNAYFANLLHQLCRIGDCAERPNPYTDDGAKDIIGSSVVLAYYDNMQKLDNYNKPLRSMGIEQGHIIPEKMVESAMCKYFGFTQSGYEALQKAAEKRMFTYGYYFLGVGDAGIVDFEVQKVVQQKNGLVCVSGIMGEGDPMPFKAFFKKSDCGGQEHWVLLKVLGTDIPEESDDFYVPQDK